MGQGATNDHIVITGLRSGELFRTGLAQSAPRTALLRSKSSSQDSHTDDPISNREHRGGCTEGTREVTIDVDHFLAMGVVVRVGGADAWAATRRLLGVGVRIGTEQQLARRQAHRGADPECDQCHGCCGKDAA
jgi:hypothetical protein